MPIAHPRRSKVRDNTLGAVSLGVGGKVCELGVVASWLGFFILESQRRDSKQLAINGKFRPRFSDDEI